MADPKVNPAWQGILDAVPPEFHSQIIPQLSEWDKGIQQKFADIRSEFDELKPYASFVENNIDPKYAEQAVILADQLQKDPAAIVNQVNEAWKLGFVSKEDAEKLGQQQAPADDDFLNELGEGNVDIFKDPRVVEMQKTLQELQGNFESMTQQEQEEQEMAEFEEYLDNLEAKAKTDKLPFHREFVTALISQGIDGEAALKQYHQVLASNVVASDEPPATNPPAETPPVMGGTGTAGSGSPDGSVDFGRLSKNDLNSTIEQMLAQQAASGQG